jgi:hypothetical protein
MKKTFSPGFTLVEMLVYIGVAAVFMGLLTRILISVLNIQLETSAASAVQTDSLYLISRLTYDIRRADAIVVPAARGVTGDSITLREGGADQVYSVSDGVLLLSGSSGSDRLTGIDTRISRFSVTRIGNLSGQDTLQVQFTLTGVAGSQSTSPQTLDYQFTAGPR